MPTAATPARPPSLPPGASRRRQRRARTRSCSMWSSARSGTSESQKEPYFGAVLRGLSPVSMPCVSATTCAAVAARTGQHYPVPSPHPRLTRGGRAPSKHAPVSPAQSHGTSVNFNQFPPISFTPPPRRKSSKYKTPSVPFPYDSKDTYERAMRQPLGREYNTGAIWMPA